MNANSRPLTRNIAPAICGPALSSLARTASFALALTLALASRASAGDWPTYKHDLRRSSVTPDTLQFPMRQLWHFAAPQPPSPAWPDTFWILNRTDFDYGPHPVIASGVVCFASNSDDTVRALDAKTGEPRWHVITGGPVRVAPQIEAGKVYFGSDDGFVYCVDAATGAIVWKFRAAPADERMVGNHRMISRWPLRTGTLVADGVVYCVAGMWNTEGVFAYALDAATGKIIWRNDNLGFLAVTIVDFPAGDDPAKESVGGHNGEFAANGAIGSNPQGAMLLNGNTLIIPNCNSSSIALDRRTGAPVSTGSGQGTWLTVDKDILYSFTRHHEDVQQVKPASLVGGSVGKGWNATTVPQVRVMPPRKDGQIHARGKVSAIVYEGKLYARHAYGSALAKGVLLIGEEDQILAQDPDTERVLWRAPVDGEPREVAVADGRIYVGTSTGALYCFETALRGAAGEGALIDPMKGLAEKSSAAPDAVVAGLTAQLAKAGMDRGFGLVLGDPEGTLSVALAGATQLRIVNITTDEKAAQALREKLLATTRLNGSRVNVQTVASLENLPFAQFFANAIIVAGPTPGLSGPELYRVLRPCGGLLLAPGLKPESAAALMASTGATEKEVRQLADGPVVARGKLPGALDWDSGTRVDARVKWPLRPLWYGGPSTAQVHGVKPGSSPVVANGRYFVRGEQSITAVDAYNGEVLWTRPSPRAVVDLLTLDGVVYPAAEPVKFTREEVVNGLAADNDSIYLTYGSAYFQAVGDDVINELGKAVDLKSKTEGRIQLDARTGQQIKLAVPYNPPSAVDLRKPQKWSIELDPRHIANVSLEAFDKGLRVTLTTQDTVVTKLDGWDLYFDFRPADSRYGLYDRGAFNIHLNVAKDKNSSATWHPGTGIDVPNFEVTGSRDPAGTSTTAILPWSEIEKLCGARPASFGFAASLSSHTGMKEEPITRRHLFCDWTADGLNNGWACIVLDGQVPKVVPRPAIMVDAFPKTPVGSLVSNGDVVTGARETPRVHPLTGDVVPKMFRLGGCGGVSSAAQLRSGSQSIYDFVDDSGMRPVGGVKTRCSTPQVVALGLLIYSEENGHCECAYPVRTSMVMAPAERRLNEDWAFFFDRPVDTYLRQAAVKFGAPGDRRDPQGTLWLGYPRIPGDRSKAFPVAAGSQSSVGARGVWLRTMSASLQLPVEVECLGGNDGYSSQQDVQAVYHWQAQWAPNRARKTYGPYRLNADVTQVLGTDRPWLYTSGIRGIAKASVKLNFLQPIVSAPVEKAPAFNVKLDDPAWKNGSSVKLPFTKADVFVRHDDENLYVAARRAAIVDRLGKTMVWMKGAKTDDSNIWEDDSFEVFLSSQGKGPVVHLGASCSGARYDALADAAKNKPEDRSWNTQWKADVAGDNTGLAIVLTIPWKSLEEAGIKREGLSMNFQVNQRDTSGEPPASPGALGKAANAGEALSYLGYLGRARCENFAPVGFGAPPPPEPRYFTVRLHFAELDEVQAGQRVFDVKIQDQLLLKDFDLVKEAGHHTALIKEFQHIPATDLLKLEFLTGVEEFSPSNVPIISAMELIDESFTPPTITPETIAPRRK